MKFPQLLSPFSLSLSRQKSRKTNFLLCKCLGRKATFPFPYIPVIKGQKMEIKQ